MRFRDYDSLVHWYNVNQSCPICLMDVSRHARFLCPRHDKLWLKRANGAPFAGKETHEHFVEFVNEMYTQSVSLSDIRKWRLDRATFPR